jgi:hypothetical protein
LQSLAKLAVIALMPRQQLVEYQNLLAQLKSCFTLTEKELENNPICHRYAFRPVMETAGTVASLLVSRLDEHLDTILNNLSDPVTEVNLSLLKDEPCAHISAFIQLRVLPEPLDSEFV